MNETRSFTFFVETVEMECLFFMYLGDPGPDPQTFEPKKYLLAISMSKSYTQ